MSPTSYQAAPPRVSSCILATRHPLSTRQQQSVAPRAIRIQASKMACCERSHSQHPMRLSSLAPALALAFPFALPAQQPHGPEVIQAGRPMASPFTAQDALNIMAVNAADLSDDGRWLATTSTLRRDNFGQ